MAHSDDADDEPTVPIRCPDCDTETRVPLGDLADTLEGHNDRLHDGETVAEVDPAVREGITDLVAADLGLLEE